MKKLLFFTLVLTSVASYSSQHHNNHKGKAVVPSLRQLPYGYSSQNKFNKDV